MNDEHFNDKKSFFGLRFGNFEETRAAQTTTHTAMSFTNLQLRTILGKITVQSLFSHTGWFHKTCAKNI